MKIQYKHEITLKEKVSNKEIISYLLQNRDVTDIDTFLNPPSPLSISLKDFGFD